MAYVKSPINVDRAGWAEAALQEFSNITCAPGSYDADLAVPEMRDERMGDFIVDLMHYAQQNGHDFDEILARSQRCFADESTGEE